ncbi:MAG: NADAR family protein [Lachnospiraceae bacterium]|nr:NADAR family protein [Lachnospiraceae bacterium]
MSNYSKKRYVLNECITFRKTNEEYGGLSNMAGGYPIYIDGVKILTSEALYQACRFPEYPEIQREIVEQRSPMTAKDISRKYDHLTRKDWASNRVQIMNWCIHLKLLYNWNKMGNLFLRTMDKEIVELSSKDDFWGAFERGDYAEGCNVLGLLLKQVRKDYKMNQDKKNITLGCPNADNFKLFGHIIGNIKVDVTENYHVGETYNLFDDYGL